MHRGGENFLCSYCWQSTRLWTLFISQWARNRSSFSPSFLLSDSSLTYLQPAQKLWGKIEGECLIPSVLKTMDKRSYTWSPVRQLSDGTSQDHMKSRPLRTDFFLFHRDFDLCYLASNNPHKNLLSAVCDIGIWKYFL